MMETLRYTFVTHYLLMPGQTKCTDGSSANAEYGLIVIGNIRDLFVPRRSSEIGIPVSLIEKNDVRGPS